MPHTRRTPPIRLPPSPDPTSSDPSQRLLSDHLADLQLGGASSAGRRIIGSSPNLYPNRVRSRTRDGFLEPPEAWEMIDRQDQSSSSGFEGSTVFSVGSTTLASGTTMGSMEVEGMAGMGPAAGRRWAAEGERRRENWAQRARESYYLQMTLATRVTWQAFLAEDRAGALLQPQESAAPEICGMSSDSVTVSYRLWVISRSLFSVKVGSFFPPTWLKIVVTIFLL